MTTKKPSAKPSSAAVEPAKMVRVNFEVTPEEHRRLKIHAVTQGRTISDILREYIATLRD